MICQTLMVMLNAEYAEYAKNAEDADYAEYAESAEYAKYATCENVQVMFKCRLCKICQMCKSCKICKICKTKLKLANKRPALPIQTYKTRKTNMDLFLLISSLCDHWNKDDRGGGGRGHIDGALIL